MWLEVLYRIDHECVCCVCASSERLEMLLPYVLFVFLYVGSYLFV